MKRRNFIKGLMAIPVIGLFFKTSTARPRKDWRDVVRTNMEMCDHLSRKYPNNLGVVAEKNWNSSLETMKEFERFTGLKVGKCNKTITYPNGSRIIFAAGNISSLSSINLGWYYLRNKYEYGSADTQRAVENILSRRLRRKDVPLRGMIS